MTAQERSTVRPVDASRALIGAAIALAAFVAFYACARLYDSGRGDFFYLADAFLHGRTWLDHALGAQDVIRIDGRVYVPFGPFPAVALMPLVWLLGPERAAGLQAELDAGLAATAVGLGWWLAGRAGVERVAHRVLLVALLGFSTPVLWITTRGGVWHTGQLMATILTLAALVELFGHRRPVLLGLLGGAAFLCRAPLGFALPFYAWAAWDGAAGSRWRAAGLVALGAVPSIAFFFWYNALRFGTPLESGYALAVLPPFLEAQREQGLFSMSHLPMNLDDLLTRLPRRVDQFPYFQPDGFGMSILVTSPGLLLAFLAPRGRMTVALALTALVVIAPSLLYYGGGWLQYGYRYALDSIPFVFALVALAVARRGLPIAGVVLIGLGILVDAGGVYWAYRL